MNDGKTWLVVNTASGSNDEARQGQLVEALGSAGAHPDRIIDAQDEECPTGAALDAASVGMLAIFTGDGTINSTLEALGDWGGKVLVLPGGTANLLAKTLHGDREAEEVVAMLPQLSTLRRHGVKCAQGTALIELLAGPGAMWSDVREAMRDGNVGEVVSEGIEAVQQSVSGSNVAIVQPALGSEEGYAGVRMTPSDHGIDIDGYGAQGFGDLLKQGLALLKRDYREGPHDKLGIAMEIECRSLDGEAIELMIDGERRTGSASEKFSLVELPLDLLAAQA